MNAGRKLVWVAALLVLASCRPPGAVAPAQSSAGTDAFQEPRSRMIKRQLTAPGRDIKNPRVLKAMEEVPRHHFVPEAFQGQAYDDRPLPIGHGQTISQPYVVAFMTEHLDPKATDRVLEIGTGSGYQAAILAELVAEVYSIEIIEALAQRAKAALEFVGYQNVHLKTGDGYLGWPEHAPFDAIIVTCSPDHVPQPLIDQLKTGGRMVIPVGTGYGQDLYLLLKDEEGLKQQAILPVRFVPMTGQSQTRQ